MSKTPLTPDTALIRSRELLEADVVGEIVALDVDRGQCYGLNAVASRIWTLLAERTTISEICSRLTEEFDVDEGTCREEVMRLAEDLYSEGLVKISA